MSVKNGYKFVKWPSSKRMSVGSVYSRMFFFFIDWTFTKANEYLKKLHNNLAQLKIKRKEMINVK